MAKPIEVTDETPNNGNATSYQNDCVELFFHMSRKGNIHYLREKLAKLIGNNLADIRRVELVLDLLDILASLDRRNDRRVCTRPSDTFFFQRLN